MPTKSQILEQLKIELDNKISTLEDELNEYLTSNKEITEIYSKKNGKRPFKEYICYHLEDIVKLKEQRKYLDSLVG